MKSDEKKDTLYLCDPQKNTECPKGNCQIPDGCFLTIKKEFAVTDENGKPTKEESYKVKMLNSCCHAGNTGRKETKMWIELNDGKLLNLEKVHCIEIELLFHNVFYYFSEKERCAETFASLKDAQQRMEDLKKLLK